MYTLNTVSQSALKQAQASLNAVVATAQETGGSVFLVSKANKDFFVELTEEVELVTYNMATKREEF